MSSDGAVVGVDCLGFSRYCSGQENGAGGRNQRRGRSFVDWARRVGGDSACDAAEDTRSTATATVEGMTTARDWN
jgi:hypothetical protein